MPHWALCLVVDEHVVFTLSIGTPYLLTILVLCVEVLWPIQPNGVMLSGQFT